MTKTKINKNLVEKAKTVIILTVIVFSVGYYVGNHEANKNKNVIQKAITTAVHQSLVKN